MPSPNKGESKSDFVGRCIGVLASEGKYTDPSQQAAICYSKWDKKKESEVKAVNEANLGNIASMDDDELSDAYEYYVSIDDKANIKKIKKIMKKRDFEMNEKEQVIEVTEDVRLPGTDILLEVGDKIKVVKSIKGSTMRKINEESVDYIDICNALIERTDMQVPTIARSDAGLFLKWMEENFMVSDALGLSHRELTMFLDNKHETFWKRTLVVHDTGQGNKIEMSSFLDDGTQWSPYSVFTVYHPTW